jgi:hypothetical protein
MHPACPECHLRFERESGFFVGAMYISYAMAVPIIAALTAVLSLVAVPDWRIESTILVAGLLFVPAVPATFRYSRILWIHLTYALDPPE